MATWTIFNFSALSVETANPLCFSMMCKPWSKAYITSFNYESSETNLRTHSRIINAKCLLPLRYTQAQSSQFRRNLALALAARGKGPGKGSPKKNTKPAPTPNIIEDPEERNEALVEAYAGIVKEYREKKLPVVEVALDVPERWWTEVVSPRIDRIVETCNLEPGKRVLDVGTGIGTMIGFLCKPGRANQEDVVGVDLCEEMLEAAEEQFPDATFVLGDIMGLELADLRDEDDDDPASPVAPKFDAVVFNAVFGSLADQRAALEKAGSLCRNGGRVVVSHPLGSAFVASLVQEDDYFTPHPLPTLESLSQMLQFLPLKVHGQVIDEEEFYLAVLVCFVCVFVCLCVYACLASLWILSCAHA